MTPVILEALFTGVIADTGMAVTVPPTDGCTVRKVRGFDTPGGGSNDDSRESTAGHWPMSRNVLEMQLAWPGNSGPGEGMELGSSRACDSIESGG